jgi:hypothetical protein
MTYIFYDVQINPFPERAFYVALFNEALTTNTDDELDTATPADWESNPYRLWILAIAREFKAYSLNPHITNIWPSDIPIPTMNRTAYKNVNTQINTRTNKSCQRYMVMRIILGEILNCIFTGQPGSYLHENTEVHLVIATGLDGTYAGHITYYDTPKKPSQLTFISIYKSIYCAKCPKFSSSMLSYIEQKAKELGKTEIHTNPIGPMDSILISHGFSNGNYTKKMGGRRCRKTLRKKSRNHRD